MPKEEKSTEKYKVVYLEKGIYISLKDNREKVRGATLTLC